jgi:predicted dehydrogenase
MVEQLKDFVSAIQEPLMMNYRVNAGAIPAEHWIHDSEQGGRVIGEVCHFVDLLLFLAGSQPVRVHGAGMKATDRYGDDNVVATLNFENGSVGTITYAANGDKSFSKERLEVFGGGSAAVLEDFRSLLLVRNGRRQQSKSTLQQDKGHRGEWEAFARSIREGGNWPIPWTELVASTLATFRIVESQRAGSELAVGTAEFIAAASASVANVLASSD